MSDTKFKIGDTVYVSKFGRREVKEKCPVCFGKLVVTLILGDDTPVELPCKYCGRGYDPPSGQVAEWRMDAGAEAVIIDQIRTAQTGAGEKVEYMVGNRSYYSIDVFSTEQEALDKSERSAAKHRQEQETRAEFIKEDTNKNYSWNAGYHRREAKKAAEKVEYHSRMAKICKAKAGGEHE